MQLMGTMFGLDFGGLLVPYAKYIYDNSTTPHSFASL